MKWICIECGEEFDRPMIVPVKVDDQFGGHTEYWDVCPGCGGADYDELAECEICGNHVAEKLLSPDGRCPQCVRKKLMEVNHDTVRN